MQTEIRIGQKIPAVVLYENDTENGKNVKKLVAKKKAIIFGVPGAFVPGCARVHLAGFIEKSNELKSIGFEEIICISVNDPFVLAAWGQQKGANGKVRLLADPGGEYTKAIGMKVYMPELGGIRSRRYSMVTINGVVKEFFIDALNADYACIQRDMPIIHSICNPLN